MSLKCSPKHGCELAYIRSTALNLARSALRRRMVEQKHVKHETVVAASAESEALGRITDLAVRRAIDQLPARQRSVIMHQHILGRSVADVARLLGISPGSVKRHGFRARAQLQQHLS